MGPTHKSNSSFRKKKIDDMTLVWLDGNISRTDDNYYSMFKLSHLFHNIRTFTSIGSFIQYLIDELNEQAIIIISGLLGNKIIPNIHRHPLIDSIYIFCQDKIKHQLWAKKYQKIQGVYTDIDFICIYIIKEKLYQNDSKLKTSFDESLKFIEHLEEKDNCEYEQVKEEFLSYYIDNQALLVSDTINEDPDENIDSYLMYFSSNDTPENVNLNDCVQQSNTVIPFIKQTDQKYFDNGTWPCLWWIIKNENNYSKMIGFNRIRHLILNTRVIEDVNIYLALNKRVNEEDFVVICDVDNLETNLPQLCYEENIRRVYLHSSSENVDKYKTIIKRFSKIISVLQHSDLLIHRILNDLMFYLIKLGEYYQKENKNNLSKLRYEYALNLQSNIQIFIKEQLNLINKN